MLGSFGEEPSVVQRKQHPSIEIQGYEPGPSWELELIVVVLGVI